MAFSPEMVLSFLHGRKKRLGEALVEQNLLTDDDLGTALIYQKAQPGKMLGTVLRELDLISDLDLMETLTANLRVVKAYSES
jgi:hypothetical protein